MSAMRPLSSLRPLRWLKWLAYLCAALAALVTVLALAVPLLDWNQARPWIVTQLGSVLQRQVQVQGDLRLSWATGTHGEAATTRWLPRLRLQAREVAIGNPAWAGSGPWLARAAAVELRFSPLDLLRKYWRITDLNLERADVTLERGADGRKNWRFTQDEQPAWRYTITRLAFDRALVRYVDRPLALDLDFAISPQGAQAAQATLATQGAAQPNLPVTGTISGQWRQATVMAKGQGAPLLDLLNDGSHYRLQASGTVGQVQADVVGDLINPHQLVRAELQLALRGASLADLYAATGVSLPATRAFHAKGMLVVTREHAQSPGPAAPSQSRFQPQPQPQAQQGTAPTTWDWHYQHFSGTVGQSDFIGDAHYLKALARPQLHMQLQWQQLHWTDLLPHDRGPGAAGGGRLLPAQPIPATRWEALDAEIALSAAQVLLPGLAWQDLKATIKLQDQVLTVEPLHFALAGGSAEGSLRLDGRQPQIAAQARLAARHLQLRKLFPRLADMQASFGELALQGELNGSGNSVAALLANADGHINAITGAGTISQFILEAAGLNLADAVFAKLYRDKQVKLYCAAADMQVRQGRGAITRFVINTEDAVIDVSGQVDLAQERLALQIQPHSKRLRVFSLTTPLTIEGSFANARVGARTAPLVGRVGAAAALALLAPAAAIVPLVTPGQELPDDCGPAAVQENQR